MNPNFLDDLDHVEKFLKKLFPDLTGILPLKYLGSGATSVVVETSNGIVFRLGKNQAAADSYERESRLLPILRLYLNLPIPKPAWYAPPCPQAPFGIFGYSKLPGVPLNRNHLKTLNWHQVAENIAVFIHQLHNSPIAQFMDLKLPPFHSKPEYLQDMQQDVLPYLKRVMSPSEYDKVHRWWYELLVDEQMQNYKPVLIHGDLFYANILLDETTSTVTGILDFENATLGDPAQDFAVQYHLGQDFAKAVITAYQKIGGVLDDTFEYRLHQLRILREFGGLKFFIENNDVSEFTHCVWKLRNGPLFEKLPHKI